MPNVAATPHDDRTTVAVRLNTTIAFAMFECSWKWTLALN